MDDTPGEERDLEPEDPTSPARITELEARNAELQDRFLRKAADLENYRKRALKDLQEARREGTVEVARALLDVLDNLERALAAVPEADRSSPLALGVELVHRQFLEALKSFGIEPLQPTGEPFDPYFHEAFAEEPSTDVPPGTVLEELVRGYRIGDRLLRASKVRVSRLPPGSGDSGATA